MSLRAPLAALRRLSASVVAPLVERNTSLLPSARRALATPPPFGVARARGVSTNADSHQNREQQQKEKPEQQEDRVKAVIAAVGVAGAAYVLWNYSPLVVPHKILQSFESGGKLGWDKGFEKDADAVVKRPDVEKKLEELFYPSPEGDLSASYVLIIGEHGTGKSTAVRRVVRDRKGVNGAIYVNVPDDVHRFGGVVAAAVGLPLLTLDLEGTFFRYLNVDTNKVREEPDGTWKKAKMAITEAAVKFRLKHKRPAVLIIDSAELLAKKNPALLEELQVFAKQRTDEGSLRMVFVSSDGSVLEMFQSQSAMSRMRKPPFEVGDVSDKAAVEFLKGKGVEEKQAEEAVRDITGGRFALLNDYLRGWRSTGNDATLQELFDKTRKALDAVKVDEHHDLFQVLVSEQRIKDRPARRLLGEKADAQLGALLEKSIIAAHPNETFTFHSRHVESFFREEVFGPRRRWWWSAWGLGWLFASPPPSSSPTPAQPPPSATVSSTPGKAQ